MERSLALCLGERPVERREILAEALQRISFGGALAAGGAHPRKARPVARQLGDRRGDGIGVARFDEKALLACGDNLGHRADRRDHRHHALAMASRSAYGNPSL
jgi:hypothetical protein